MSYPPRVEGLVNMIYKLFFVCTEINVKTVLFRTVPFSVIQFQRKKKNKHLYYKQFSLALIRSLVPFDPWIWPSHMLPLWAKLDLGLMAIKRWSTFLKALASLDPQHQIFSVISKKLVGGSYPSAGMQSVYSTASADWATNGIIRVR